MSTEKNSQENVTLELIDLINAAKIMEHAVARNAFQIDELVNVAPVVSKFVKFANTALAEIQAKEAADTDGNELADQEPVSDSEEGEE